MKKVIVLFIFILHSFFYAQSKDIDCKIKFVDGKEINTKIRFKVNLFWSDLIDESSIAYKTIQLIDKNGEISKTPSINFNKIEFIDLKNKKRVFIRMPEYDGLVELIYAGKIKWVRYYYPHGYDRSTQQADHFYKEGFKMVGLGLFSNSRKKLKELMYDRPDLFQLIEQINYNRLKDEQLIEVLKKYDE